MSTNALLDGTTVSSLWSHRRIELCFICVYPTSRESISHVLHYSLLHVRCLLMNPIQFSTTCLGPRRPTALLFPTTLSWWVRHFFGSSVQSMRMRRWASSVFIFGWMKLSQSSLISVARRRSSSVTWSWGWEFVIRTRYTPVFAHTAVVRLSVAVWYLPDFPAWFS